MTGGAVGLVQLPLLFLLGPVLGPAASFAVMLFFLPAARRRSLRAAITLDDAGLTEWFTGGWRSRTPFSAITRVEVDFDSARIHTKRGSVRIDASVDHWRRLVAACAAAIGQDLPDPSAAAPVSVPADEVERWLRLGPGETLTADTGSHGRPGLMVACVVGAVLLGLAPGMPGPQRLVSMAVVLVVGLMFIPAVSMRALRQRHLWVREVRAGAGGIELRVAAGWRRLAWSDILCVERQRDWVVLVTQQGYVWLPPRTQYLDQLEQAATNAVEARRAGQALPRLTADVPDAALSRAAADAAEVERGLSPPEERP